MTEYRYTKCAKCAKFTMRGDDNMFFSKVADRLLEKRVAAYQSEMIKRHVEEVRGIYTTMRGWRHDYKNHIQTLLALVGDDEKTREYLWSLNNDLTEVDAVLKTGNIALDAILNSKLTLIKSKDIPVEAKASVSDNLKISDVDLCAIIGNLLDNAIEAVGALPKEEQFIRIYIGMLKSQLYISVINSSLGSPKRRGEKYLSTKGEGRGLGLIRIDGIVENAGGTVNRKTEQGVFATEILV